MRGRINRMLTLNDSITAAASVVAGIALAELAPAVNADRHGLAQCIVEPSLVAVADAVVVASGAVVPDWHNADFESVAQIARVAP